MFADGQTRPDCTANVGNNCQTDPVVVLGQIGDQMTAATAPALTALDRCDRCGAQAYVRVVLQAGGELLFCGHHYTENAEALAAKAAEVHDGTHLMDVWSFGFSSAEYNSFGYTRPMRSGIV